LDPSRLRLLLWAVRQAHRHPTGPCARTPTHTPSQCTHPLGGIQVELALPGLGLPGAEAAAHGVVALGAPVVVIEAGDHTLAPRGHVALVPVGAGGRCYAPNGCRARISVPHEDYSCCGHVKVTS